MSGADDLRDRNGIDLVVGQERHDDVGGEGQQIGCAGMFGRGVGHQELLSRAKRRIWLWREQPLSPRRLSAS
ncbi:hypothetical protein D3C73_1342810 [compost metagenome]